MKFYLSFFLLLAIVIQTQAAKEPLTSTYAENCLKQVVLILNTHGIAHRINSKNADQQEIIAQYCRDTQGKKAVTTFGVEFDSKIAQENQFDNSRFTDNELTKTLENM